jgi:hypothetical protein
MTQPYEGHDPNFTQEWWDLICASPGKIREARAHSRAVARGDIIPERHDFRGVLRRITLGEEEPKPLSPPKGERGDRLLPARLRDE